ncbi:MAG: hypothetical protein JJE36_04395 [Coriobacteriia bacterium]|nr:hypothetical protein [Coriobacteriia bacterium]
MSKVYIIGLKKYFLDALEELQTYGKVHLTDLSDGIAKGEMPIESMRLFKTSEEELDELRSLKSRGQILIKNLFGNPGIDSNCSSLEREEKLSIAALAKQANEYFAAAEPEASGLVQKVEDLSEEQAELLQYEPLLVKIEPTVKKLVGDKDMYSTAIIVEARFRAAANELRDMLEKISEGAATTVVKSLGDEMLGIVVVVDNEHAPIVRQTLSDEHVNHIKLPGTFEELPFSEALRAIHERIEILPEKIDKAQIELALYAENQREKLCETTYGILNCIHQLEAIEQFGETAYTFVIAGYVPSDELPELKKLLEDKWANGVVVDEIPIETKEYSKVPVELENGARFKPFQAALGIWGQPVYGTFDPSFIIAMSFPFIFGMIVGDVGYGLLLLGFCLFFKWKYPKNGVVQAFTGVLAPGGLMAIVFGVFYFEFFGNLASEYIPGLNTLKPIQITSSFSLPFIRTSSDMMMTLLVMAISIGFIEIVAGLIMGVVNHRHMGERKEAIEKSGILVILFAVLAMVTFKFVPVLTSGLSTESAAIVSYLIYFVLAVGFIVSIAGGGIMGAIETMESVSHIASYIRIMAIGLVGALLADAANKLAFVTMPNAAGIFLALILHVLNFAIICFSPSIHALRLTFLEFFGKFLETGKVSYKPFAHVGKDEQS